MQHKKRAPEGARLSFLYCNALADANNLEYVLDSQRNGARILTSADGRYSSRAICAISQHDRRKIIIVQLGVQGIDRSALAHGMVITDADLFCASVL